MNVQLLSARQLDRARPMFIKSLEIISRQTTVDSLLSVAAGQPSDSIAIVCSNEFTFLAKSTIAYCMHNNFYRVSFADVQRQSSNCHRC